MNVCSQPLFIKLNLLLLIICTWLPVQIAGAQSAGDLIRDNPLPEPVPKAKAPTVKPSLPVIKSKRKGPFFEISTVEISGVTLFSMDEFEGLTAQVTGSAASLTDIENLASAIDRFYISKGYISHTLIPAQDITSGLVKLIVVESKLGNVDLKTPEEGVRFNLESARDIAVNGQPDSGLLNVNKLQESMGVLSDTPGLAASAQLIPSATVEGTDVVIRLEDTGLMSSTVQLDNHGSRYVGQERITGFAVLDSPFGLGDQLTGTVVETRGSDTLALTGSLPVFNNGSRVLASLSWLDYSLVDSDTSGSGSALSMGLQLTVPKMLAPQWSSIESLGLNISDVVNKTEGIETSDKKVISLTAGSRGSWLAASSKAAYSYDMSFTLGDVDLSGNSSDKSSDALTAKKHGAFFKINGQMTRQQRLSDDVIFTMMVKGQYGFNNLDSSQKMSLGGARGIRAYPTGEAAGDTALLYRVELKRQFEPSLSGQAFFDGGWVKLNHDTWSGWQSGVDSPNTYSINGVGIGFDWFAKERVTVKGQAGFRLGSNPGRDSKENDSDGRDSDVRVWLQVMIRI